MHFIGNISFRWHSLTTKLRLRQTIDNNVYIAFEFMLLHNSRMCTQSVAICRISKHDLYHSLRVVWLCTGQSTNLKGCLEIWELHYQMQEMFMVAQWYNFHSSAHTTSTHAVVTAILTLCDLKSDCQKEQKHWFSLSFRCSTCILASAPYLRHTPKLYNLSYDTDPYHYKRTTVFANNDDKPCKKNGQSSMLCICPSHINGYQEPT